MIFFKRVLILLLVVSFLGSFSGVYSIMTLDGGGKTIYVSKNGNDSNDGFSPDHAKDNIVTALNTAVDGDIINVGPGVYSENVVINKNITLIGSGQDKTVIDGHQASNCIKIGRCIVKIFGLTIKNGKPDENNNYLGGGIYNSDGIVTIENSTITDNTAKSGGGIYNNNRGWMHLIGVVVKNNHATDKNGKGGGICNDASDVKIEDSTITGNDANLGGGIYDITYFPYIQRFVGMSIYRSTINNNHAVSGGGICNNACGFIVDSVISDNVASNEGGGIFNSHAIVLSGTKITNNRAIAGGGIWNADFIRANDLALSLITGNKPDNVAGQGSIFP